MVPFLLMGDFRPRDETPLHSASRQDYVREWQLLTKQAERVLTYLELETLKAIQSSLLRDSGLLLWNSKAGVHCLSTKRIVLLSMSPIPNKSIPSPPALLITATRGRNPVWKPNVRASRLSGESLPSIEKEPYSANSLFK